ncbi:BamA/TamA family outer membrane protein [Gelidibacter salicanalis]|uniref:BamA/TamA family outer membrane protein n=1 Tax=Gelidibacter salicanalis TaxID=291193 RepID=A0A5C7ASS1_9FLAO|nr:BamA/TamA family outer membrane protein [Gelidibacter salicanalis]
MKLKVAKISFITTLILMLSSCNAVKRLSSDELLLMDNTVYVNDKKNNTDALNNLLYQKPNGRFPLLGTPIRLHIYNLARPNIDSILDAKYRNSNDPKTGLKNFLSLKQYEALINSKSTFNSWLKTTGEPPVIIKPTRAEKSTTNLKTYYYKNGWFNADASYKVDTTDTQKGEINYYVNTGDPYYLDSIRTKIYSPVIDTLYKSIKKNSLLVKGEQFKESNLTNERDRMTTELRNSGLFHFAQDYITFEIDTIGTNKKVNTDIIVQNRTIRYDDSIEVTPFKIYKIKDVNIFTDDTYQNKDVAPTDTINYKGFHIYSYGKSKYRAKALTDAVFITKGGIFKDINRTRTYRHLSELRTFKYPNIEYIENDKDTTLTTNIYLIPKKKFGLNFNAEVSQSNIQTIGFAFSGGLLMRNVFRGAETLEVSGLSSIGASKDAKNSKDAFFDITEIGATVKLTIPRLFFPVNTDKVIPKYMSPSTRILTSATSQRNIGLDKQTFTGNLSYNWYPNQRVTNTLDLISAQFVKNLNVDNYFGVYQNSFSSLNTIAKDIQYIDRTQDLSIPNGANQFIRDVLSQGTALSPIDEDYKTISNIDQRKTRLTENNLIISSSFNYIKNKRVNIFDNDFSIIRFRVEFAGNILATIGNLTGAPKNDNDRYDIFGVAFSQYTKTEFDYVKYWDLGKRSVFAVRSYFGIAVPYGNSENIPFSKSFFAGGPNDNRAWTAYNLGPGSLKSTNEFNEANLKLHFSVEQRFNLFGSLFGAFFVDAGNIWNVFDNVTDEAQTFDGLSSLKDIAVGSGFGLRYDFSFFVLRGDIGFKTYDPSYNVGDRWFKDYNFNNAVYNIGINYPF